MADLDDLGGSSDEEQEEEEEEKGSHMKTGDDEEEEEEDYGRGGVEEEKGGGVKVKTEILMEVEDSDGFQRPKPKIKSETGVKKEAADADVDKLLTKMKGEVTWQRQRQSETVGWLLLGLI